MLDLSCVRQKAQRAAPSLAADCVRRGPPSAVYTRFSDMHCTAIQPMHSPNWPHVEPTSCCAPRPAVPHVLLCPTSCCAPRPAVPHVLLCPPSCNRLRCRVATAAHLADGMALAVVAASTHMILRAQTHGRVHGDPTAVGLAVPLSVLPAALVPSGGADLRRVRRQEGRRHVIGNQ